MQLKTIVTTSHELNLGDAEVVEIMDRYNGNIKSYLSSILNVDEIDVDIEDFDEYEFDNLVKEYYNHEHWGNVLLNHSYNYYAPSTTEYKPIAPKLHKIKPFCGIRGLEESEKYSHIYYHGGYYYATNRYIAVRVRADKKEGFTSIPYYLISYDIQILPMINTIEAIKNNTIYSVEQKEMDFGLKDLFNFDKSYISILDIIQEDGYYLIQTSKRDFKIEAKHYELALTLGEIKSVKFADNRVLLVGDDFEVIVTEMEGGRVTQLEIKKIALELKQIEIKLDIKEKEIISLKIKRNKKLKILFDYTYNTKLKPTNNL